MPEEKKNRAVAFQFYPDKWLSHTRRLGDSAYRVYHELLCWMWQSSPDHCSIEATPEAVSCAIAQPLQYTKDAFADIMNAYAPLLKLEDEKWVSNGLRKEVAKQAKTRLARQKAAYAKHAAANAENNDANTPVTATLLIPTPTPTLFPTPLDLLPPTPLKPSRTRKPRKSDLSLTLEQQPLFERFWAEYPRHEKRAEAVEAWMGFVSTLADQEHVIKAASQYAEACSRRCTAKNYIALPASWIHDARWDDDYSEAKPKIPEGMHVRGAPAEGEAF